MMMMMMKAIGAQQMFSNIARAISTYIRTDGNDTEPGVSSNDFRPLPAEPVIGVASETKIQIRVRWPRSTLLGSAQLFTFVFLVMIILDSSRYEVNAWRSEPLSLLYHGIEPETDDVRILETVGQMHRQSAAVKVRLQETATRLRLTTTV